mmetsp:Transcript_52075/g.153625  ORF Transcript_52075/g.153625 Transcript_52075/m.153625 type:complete len:343 (+) Transcript_52075:708-1736(+)
MKEAAEEGACAEVLEEELSIPGVRGDLLQARETSGRSDLQVVDHHEGQGVGGQVSAGGAADAMLLGPDLDQHPQLPDVRVQARVGREELGVLERHRGSQGQVHVERARGPASPVAELEDRHPRLEDAGHDLEAPRALQGGLDPHQHGDGREIAAGILAVERHDVQVRAVGAEAVHRAAERLDLPGDFGQVGVHDVLQVADARLDDRAAVRLRSAGREEGLHAPVEQLHVPGMGGDRSRRRARLLAIVRLRSPILRPPRAVRPPLLRVVHVGVAASRGVQDGGEGDGASHLGLLVLKVEERLEDMLGHVQVRALDGGELGQAVGAVFRRRLRCLPLLLHLEPG